MNKKRGPLTLGKDEDPSERKRTVYSFSTKQLSSKSSPQIERPSLVEIVEQSGICLRRVGKELVGLCPFHDEKTPSFYVNPDKELFHCHGCQAGGDVFAYVMQLKGVGFKEALTCLGLAGTPRILKPIKPLERAAAEIMVAWAKETSLTLSFRMQLLTGGVIDKKGADGFCSRQWHIMETLDDDLANPQLLLELWRQRDVVERIVNGC